MGMYEDIEQGLLEAIEAEKNNVKWTERENMPAPTYYISDNEDKIIERFIEIRKQENISQRQLAELTGNKQQTISRMENKSNSPSLKNFLRCVNAMGYDLAIIKK